MNLAYLTGQRPADMLEMSRLDIRNDELHVLQNKTGHTLRIRLHVDGEPTQLGACLDRLMARPVKSMTGALVCTEQGQRLTLKMLRDRFDGARLPAAAKAEKDRNVDLAVSIRAFQFRDIRPKAASEMAASKTLASCWDTRISRSRRRFIGGWVRLSSRRDKRGVVFYMIKCPKKMRCGYVSQYPEILLMKLTYEPYRRLSVRPPFTLL
jgi:hypothetical protein